MTSKQTLKYVSMKYPGDKEMEGLYWPRRMGNY